jgi:glycosyltransferase involved in cell wall biosynthesis
MHDSVPETFLAKFENRSPLMLKLLVLEEALSAALAKHIICVNQVQRDILLGRGISPGKISISMNLPDPKIFHNGSRTFKKKTEDAVRIVYHGTITRRLGIDLLISAVAALRKRIPEIELHIWGEGEFLHDCEQLAADLHLAHNVRFHGTIPIEALPEILRTMDIGVIPNRRSAAADLMLPVKLLEYVILGIPVVAPRFKCIEHYFSPGMLMFYEAGNLDSLTDAIFHICADQNEREMLARNALTFFKSYFWERHKSTLIELYTSLL